MEGLKTRRPPVRDPSRPNAGSADTSHQGKSSDEAVPFKHNWRFLVASIPCFAVLLLFGGLPLIAVAFIGLTVTYIIDTTGLSEGTMATFASTVFAATVTLSMRVWPLVMSNLMNLFLLWNMGFFMVMLGLWGMIQMSFIQEFSLMVCVGAERLLFALMPLTIITLTTWASVATVGIEAAPYAMILIYIAVIYLLGLPLQSSYGAGKTQSFAVAGLYCTLFITMPFGFYSVLHGGNITAVGGYMFLANGVLLVCLPLLALSYLSTKGALWWAGYTEDQLPKIRALLTVVPSILVIGAFEYRVVFHAFSHYIHMPPPYSYFIVTFALYAHAWLVVLHFNGGLRRWDNPIAYAFVAGGAMCVCVLIGAPVYIWPIAMIAAGSLVFFYFRRRVSAYMLFVVMTTICVHWFLGRTLGQLTYEFEVEGVVFSLPMVRAVLLKLLANSMAIPGVLMAAKSPFIAAALLILHAALLAIVEFLLHTVSPLFYPSWLVVVTTIVGCLLSYRLEQSKLAPSGVGRILMPIYLSKLVLLLGPVHLGVPAAALVLLTLAPIITLDKAPRMSVRQGCIHAAAIGFTLFITRHTLLGNMLHVLHGGFPEESLLFAATTLAFGVACLPLAYQFFPHMIIVRRLNVLALLTGILFLVFRPSFEFWDVVESLILSFSSPIYGRTAPKPLWPPWLFVTSGNLIFAGVLSLSPLSASTVTSQSIWRRFFTAIGGEASLRIIYGIVLGSLLGLGVAGMYLPGQPILYLLYSAACGLAATVMVLAFRPSAVSFMLPITYFGYMMVLPIIFLMEGWLFRFLPAPIAREYVINTRICVIGLYAYLNVVIAFVIKRRVGPLPQQSIDTASRGADRLMARQKAPVTDWMPVIGNIAAIIAYALAVYLNLIYMGGTETVIIVLAPFLLLLNQESMLFPWLKEANRYSPVLAGGVAAITIASLGHLVGRQMFALTLGIRRPDEQMDTFSIVKEIVLTLAPLPTYVISHRFMTYNTRLSITSLMVVAPLCVLALVAADTWPVRMLGLFGLVWTPMVAYIARGVQQRAAQFI